ncbi:YqgE/AlgH family protein [Vibrio sp. SS-MA-C1-2]|uniref:YqgE/AlgH family protein n=1 Tax=Vibrio sp. SS-MA-C1-2 TaxID=2908646 RepID=UPI001F4023F1|nr:YqgE/AlgH family protein [Vibrio sp. SS-MA-C1-2]UJF19062.1 YqgE/AlgH family protein [Vibrio sp. SS-MA-C1-2]
MNLTNHFLIAMPSMEDPAFKNSVVYICEHDEKGAMGITINRPINISVSNMLEQVTTSKPVYNEACHNLEQSVLSGGPVASDRGFIIHNAVDRFDSTMKVTSSISVTTSKDILETLTTNDQPTQFIVALGYSGWDAGQLEQELATNSWLTISADPDILFSTPIEEKWKVAMSQLGIDTVNLSSQVGHA